jgi:peptide/nickel transport system permease protein
VFAYIIRRLLYSIPVLLATSFLIFTFVSITGDPLGKIRSRPLISQAELAAISHEKKLDKPVVVRYGYWLKGAVHGDFGRRCSPAGDHARYQARPRPHAPAARNR